MRRKLVVTTLIVFLVILFYVFVGVDRSRPGITSTSTLTPVYSDEANRIFFSLVAGNADLNSGITLERATSVVPEQSNNVNFAVFNHTDEPIIFPDQGFGITLFGYDDLEKCWERLQLDYVPHPEPKTLPPKLESWDLEINNGWDILESEVLSLRVEQFRIYVSGSGVKTGRTYGAYLDVSIYKSP